MKALLLSMLGLMFGTPAWSQNVDFSGIWDLDVRESQMGAEHVPADYQRIKVISQSGNHVQQTEYEKHGVFFGAPIADSSWKTDLVVDGEVHRVAAAPIFSGMRASEADTTVEWQGNNLVIDSSGESRFGGIWSSSRRYFLSKNGAELVELVTIRGSSIEREERLVFRRSDKQKPDSLAR